ncbi:Fusaridione A cluster transcription factor fsdR [Fusarium oxysporum f. sp. rapae]|uniref:Fusaridione A cluster transcription factor fsdR n=1 Tax=Fusarium oxysporum f. sp. rapae TaxID=485398 RepID=A0A8J5PC14_FUSOX|nr:Fusaridione A cluster transcription factor fsdR [Fusarium oxysporum f. sp. rapae]
METAQSSRRKACDYCVSRKVKCDGRKPTCSSCTLYAVTCKTTVTSRRKAPRNGGITPAPSSQSETQPDRTTALEERLANIEALLTALGAPQTQPGLDISLSSIDVSGSSNDWGISPIQTPLDVANCQHASISDADSQLTKSAPSDQLELAPLSEVLPLVDSYFRNYNTVIPLFEENAFMRMLLDWYSSSTKRSTVPWAAINVVLAINYRILEGKTMHDHAFSQSIRNVRSVMSELMMQGQDLMGLQVLLGMVILFQGSSEVQLAIVLTGSVIRLAQSLRLNSKKALAGLSKSEQAHRARLFWLTYIYDREMAQRSQCPYHQPDCETDMDLPEANPEENIGIITSSTDNIRFNYLRSSAKFAFIQGKAHDLLYSQKSHTLTPEKKANSIARIEELLKEWVDEIPPELRTTEGIDKRLSPVARNMITNLWSRHIETRIKIHSIFTFEDTWINRVRRYLSPAVIDISDDVDGEVRRADLTPLPAGWEECVGYSRVCLELISSSKLTEYILWLHTCTALPCLILIIVNMIEFPDHNLVTQDRKLLDSCFGVFDDVIKYLPKEPFDTILSISHQLDRRAKGQVYRTILTKGDASYNGDFQMSPSTAWALLDDMEFQ